ncbi:MAG TPA: hypothetical protein VGP44_00360 [Gemmatimonadales bacterium]|nr:hypothetical protein [Gemmatimonadales bacterium]
MALTTAANVRAVGGLDEASDHLLFRDPDDAALDARINALIPAAAAWLRTRAPVYYASTDVDIIALFTHAESLLTLILLVETLKARKVYGSHFPFDSETSDRYEALIDTEWPKQLEMLIDPYLTIETEGTAFAMPQLVFTQPVSRPAVRSFSDLLQDVIDEATGFLPFGAGVAV